MRTHSYDASYQMIRDCVREIRPVRQDLFHRRHETEKLTSLLPFTAAGIAALLASESLCGYR